MEIEEGEVTGSLVLARVRRVLLLAGLVAMGILMTGTSAQAAGPPVTPVAWSPTTTDSTYVFKTIDGVGGQTATQTFTLTNSGGRATGTLAPIALTNTSHAAFSIINDGCSGLSLGPNKSCQVTVKWAPTANGEIDGATLTATAEHANASITLSGKGGRAIITLIPGTPTGTQLYNFDFGQVSTGYSDAQTFTVKNSGNAPSNTLQLDGLLANTGFTLSNDQTSGHKLAPLATSTFQLTFSQSCSTASTPQATPLVVNGDNGSPYLSVTYTATCVPSISSATATATLTNTSPEFITIGTSVDAVNGTLKNVSFSPPPPTGCSSALCTTLAHHLHGFTIQFPFHLDAGTMNCDMSNSYVNGAPYGFCSVSNNASASGGTDGVLTVTQNFPMTPGYLGVHWAPGYSGSMGYGYVSSSVPTQVHWLTPTAILVAVR